MWFTSNSNDEHCMVCGNSLIDAEPIDSKSSSIKQTTFFCLKCNQENLVDNFNCSSCGDDFSMYNIKASFSETSKSRTGAAKDAIKPLLFHSNKSSTLTGIKLLMVFSGLVFVTLSIIAALAFNIWNLGLGSLAPTFFAFVFGIIWLLTTIIWLVRRKNLSR